MLKSFLKICLILFVVSFVFNINVTPLEAARRQLWGETSSELSEIGEIGYELSGGVPKDPRWILIEVIMIFLEFLAIIFLVLMLYAGFLWMTAAGSEDKINKAKGIIKAAVIGLAIVLAAYAITQFVFNSVLKATN